MAIDMQNRHIRSASYVALAAFVCTTSGFDVASADIIHVPGDYPTIQGGIDAADPGDTVMVAANDHHTTETTGVPVQDEFADFAVPNDGCVVEVFSITLSESGSIDPDTCDVHSEPGYCSVYFGTFDYDGEYMDIDYEYVTVYSERPVVNKSISLMGSGFDKTFVYGGSDQPIVSVQAPGVLVEGFCMWSANGWGDVAGVHVSGAGDVVIRRNMLGEMNGWGDVCGIRVDAGDGAIVTDNLIVGCGGWEDVSAIRILDSADCVVRNNTIYDVGSWEIKAGIRFDNCPSGIVQNNIVDDIYDGYGIYCSGSVITLSHNCFHECGYYGVSAGPGDINSDPQFVDPWWGFVLLQGDYHLGGDSPCIDAGDPAFVADPGETDIDGQARVMDGDDDGLAVVDMGADELWSCPADITGDGVVDVLDLLEVLSQWGGSGSADITGDGVVDVLDLLEVLAAWGPC